MARSNHLFEQPLRSYKGLLKRSFRKGNNSSMETHLLRIWGTAQMQRIARTLDLMEESDDGPRFLYARSTLLFFCVAVLALGCNRRMAHNFIQGSDRLRAAVGLPPISASAREALDASEDDEDVAEPGFPTRQMISEFVNWLKRWLANPAHELEGVEGLNFLRKEAYEESVVDVFARHPELRANAFAIDGKRVLSPNAGPDHRKRTDEGAEFHTKDGSRVFCRMKFSAVNQDVPLILYSEMTSPVSELAYAQNTFVPHLVNHIERLRSHAKTAAPLAGLHRAMVCGDGIFRNSKITQQLYEHDLLAGFRRPNGVVREFEGLRRVESKGEIAVLDVCNDGVHLCDCDRIAHKPGCDGSGPDCDCPARPIHERALMFQDLHAYGLDGGVYVTCLRPTCSHAGTKFYVRFTKPNVTSDGELIAKPGPAYDLVSPVWRGDIRYHDIVFKATQAVEHYHGQLAKLLGIGFNDRSGRRQFFGNFANEFWFTLGDLIWNLNIGFKLDRWKADGKVRDELSWENLWGRALNQWHEIWRKTDGKRLPGETRAAQRARVHMPRLGAYYLGKKLIT